MNISFYLGEHGWSICWIYSDGEIYEIQITHALPDDPIDVCLTSLMGIMRGEKLREFFWYGEPGGEKITIEEIPTKKYMVKFHTESFREPYGKEVKGLKKVIDFEMTKKQLIRMFYFEFKKISELLKDKHYEQNRKGDFPFQRFRDFEQLATEYIELANHW
jgi:hypothetical protein